MGQEFNVNREKNKTEAWKIFQRRLNENAGALTEIMSAKEIVELSMKIEESMKTESAHGTGNPLDEVRLFLGGEKVH